MNHNGESTHMPTSFNESQYAYPVTNGTGHNVLEAAAAYGTCMQQLVQPYWSGSRTCSEPLALDTDRTLYAPIPLSGHQPLLFPSGGHYGYPELPQQPMPITQESIFSSPQGHHERQTTAVMTTDSSFCDLLYPQDENHAAYCQREFPTRTFPTPSELLVEMAGNPANTNAHGDTNRNLNDPSRRPRRRIASSVIPGDSLVLSPHPSAVKETISSHEKKRQYLECLEQYVMFLHQQLNLVGTEPVPLERVPQYRGLNNRSIRTLLVHMESTARNLNTRTMKEEQRFVELRDAVYRQDASVQTYQNRNVNNNAESG